jgi:nitroreductase
MADFMEIIRGRRSIRRFQAKDIPDEDLNTILEAVRWAPSWANTQCWEVVVVKDPSIKQRLQETLSAANPAKKAVVEAPVVMVLCGRRGVSGCYRGKPKTKLGDWFMHDVGLATQNLCLAAHALNLGTVIIGSFSHDRAKEILGIPDGYDAVALIPLGYPAGEAKQSHRRQIGEFVHYNTF